MKELHARDEAALAKVQKLRFFPQAVVGGKGASLRTDDGREVIDLSAAWGAASLGYGHPALVMSDRIAVMNKGAVVQVGSPDEIYDRPDNAFAATFVGEMNILPGRIEAVLGNGLALIATSSGVFKAANPKGLGSGELALLCVRPERMKIATANDEVENKITGRVIRRDLEGAWTTLAVETKGRVLSVHLPHARGDSFSIGEINLTFDPAEALLLPEGVLQDD